MEKLIELFRDYVDNHWTDTKDIEREYWVIDYWQWFQYWTREYLYEVIISKKFWFIKWLVENDKIDRDEIIINSDFMPIAFDRKWEKYEWSEEKQLLMLLSISDTPIEDLISYLK